MEDSAYVSVCNRIGSKTQLLGRNILLNQTSKWTTLKWRSGLGSDEHTYTDIYFVKPSVCQCDFMKPKKCCHITIDWNVDLRKCKGKSKLFFGPPQQNSIT